MYTNYDAGSYESIKCVKPPKTDASAKSRDVQSTNENESDEKFYTFDGVTYTRENLSQIKSEMNFLKSKLSKANIYSIESLANDYKEYKKNNSKPQIGINNQNQPEIYDNFAYKNSRDTVKEYGYDAYRYCQLSEIVKQLAEPQECDSIELSNN